MAFNITIEQADKFALAVFGSLKVYISEHREELEATVKKEERSNITDDELQQHTNRD